MQQILFRAKKVMPMMATAPIMVAVTATTASQLVEEGGTTVSTTTYTVVQSGICIRLNATNNDPRFRLLS